jgi:hypothetical protein
MSDDGPWQWLCYASAEDTEGEDCEGVWGGDKVSLFSESLNFGDGC